MKLFRQRTTLEEIHTYVDDITKMRAELKAAYSSHSHPKEDLYQLTVIVSVMQQVLERLLERVV